MKLDPIGELFEKSWTLFRKRFMTAIEIFLVPWVLIAISQLLIAENTPSALILGGIFNIFVIIASVLASIALITLFGKGTTFAESYKNGFSLFWPAVWVAILVVLAVFGGFALLLIPGIMLGVQLSFANYALVLNGKQGLAALTQSREYMKGYWWAYVGRGFLLGLIYAALAIVILIPAKILLGDVGAAIVYGILALFVTPFLTAYQFEIFDNLRRLKPDVAHETPKTESAFLKVAMVLGVVAIITGILLVYAIIFFAAIPSSGQNAGNGNQYPPAQGTQGDNPAPYTYPGGAY